MNNQLPIRDVYGSIFIVDVMAGEIKDMQNMKNSISFSDMELTKAGYTFSIDPATKQLAKNGIPVSLPLMTNLDPARMIEKYEVEKSSIKSLEKFESSGQMRLFDKRISGHLPIIDIVDHPFFVDLRMEALRPKDEFGHYINLATTDYAYERPGYEAIYNPATKKTVQLDINTIT